jgi:hypothetical protein
MELSYATILVFGGEHRRLYREAHLAYIISDKENPTNHPIFALDTDLGSSMFQLTNAPQTPIEIRKQSITVITEISSAQGDKELHIVSTEKQSFMAQGLTPQHIKRAKTIQSWLKN